MGWIEPAGTEEDVQAAILFCVCSRSRECSLTLFATITVRDFVKYRCRSPAGVR